MKKFRKLISALMALTLAAGISAMPVSALENAEQNPIRVYENGCFLKCDTYAIYDSAVYDTYHMYGSDDENYSVYYRETHSSKLEIAKVTYRGNCIDIIPADGADKESVLEKAGSFIDLSGNGITVTENESDGKLLSLSIEEKSVTGSLINLSNASAAVKALSDAGLITDAEYVHSRETVKTGCIITDKYSAEYKDVLEEALGRKDRYCKYSGIYKLNEESEYGSDYVTLSPVSDQKSMYYHNDYSYYGQIYRDTGAAHEIIWNDGYTDYGTKIGFDELKSYGSLPEITADTEENLEIARKLISSYTDLSDGGCVYINPEYGAYVRSKGTTGTDFEIIIYGIKKDSAPEKQSDIFVKNSDLPIWTLGDVLKGKVYSGMCGGAVGNIDSKWYNAEIYMCVENELPVKKAHIEKNDDGTDYIEVEERMTEEETPDYMLRYIYPDRYAQDVSLQGGILMNLAGSDMTLSFGDVNGDLTEDLSDLTELSLYLLGDKDFTDGQKSAADVNADGTVNVADLAYLRLYLTDSTVVKLGR